MKEILTMENFLGLNCEVQLNKINLIIGPQSSGKSVIAKLFYFFKNIDKLLVDSISSTRKKFDSELENKFLQYFSVDSFANDKFRITFKNARFEFIITNDFLDIIQIKYSNSFKEHIKKITELLNKHKKESIRSLPISGIIKSRQTYIPAGRSLFTFMQDNIFTWISEERSIDSFLMEFGSYYEIVKRLGEKRFSLAGHLHKNTAVDELADKLVALLLKGKFIRKDGKDFIVSDKILTPLEFTSSGQQEILPLILVLKRLMYTTRASIYIEEPEAHLFPVSQKYITELIALVFNETKNQIFITTHSPYILTAFNNLIYAGQLEETLKTNKTKSTKLNKIIPEKLRLKISDISAYTLDDKGNIISIINSETGLIDGNVIDSVSDELGSSFDQLLDLN